MYNNGTQLVPYNTTSTIFSHATLLESLKYASDSVGTYNFVKGDTLVTYGVELSNSGTSGRNPDKQYQYYDGGFITDEQDKTDQDAAYVRERYKDSNFIRYVYVAEGGENNAHELDINQKTVGLTSGCGTYGDPYLIDNPDQLIALEKYLNETTRASVADFQVKFNSKVLSGQTQTGTSYHCAGVTLAPDTTGTDDVYTCNGGTWKNAADEDANGEFLLYLQNAYYQIQNDITIDLSTTGYTGLGTESTPFSGVIVGLTGAQKVSLIGIRTGLTNFGGLIRYSRGSVVKDLAVDYSKAQITMSNSAVPSYANNPFFGGVVGYCMGGDTIIDNVSVTYGGNSVSLDGSMQRMIAAGGYVGLVGGVKGSDGYEKTGGGVVFRNMEGKSGLLSVNAGTISATAEAKTAENENGSTYFYCNPYVGRVLDGYACYDGGTSDQSTLNNTDKNYTIPDVTGNGGLAVSQANDGSLTATVTSAQGLWLLSAIVNSGAGAMDADGAYQDAKDKTVDAYQIGKPRSRTADYSNVGNAVQEGKTASDYLIDEARWGGVAGTDGKDPTRVSYLVSGFTSSDAAKLTGRSSTTNVTSTNNPVSLTFSPGEIDMEPYGNGFRGIGGSYGQSNQIWSTGGTDKLSYVYRRTLYVKAVNGATNGTTLILNMNQRDYGNEDNYSDKTNPGFFNQGAGLFTNFSYVAGCMVKELTIRGEVKLHTYTVDGTESYADKGNGDDFDICVGAFAARTKNATGELRFDGFHLLGIQVYGGNQTGGAFGCVEQSGGKKTVTFQNWSLEGATIETKLNNNGGAGGLVGWYYGGQQLTVDNGTVSDTEVNTDSKGISSNSVGGLANGSNFDVVVKNVTLSGLSVSGTKLNSAGGLLGSGQAMITVESCTLSGLSVQVTGSYYVGGLVGFASANTTISGTHIKCSEDSPATIRNDGTGQNARTGGFIGSSGSAKNSTTIENCSAEYLYVLSKSRTGGLFGQNANKPAKIRNVAMRNVIVTTYGKNGEAGLLAGRVGDTDKTIHGYNILADSCRVGYWETPTPSFKELANATFTKSNFVGRWTGQLSGGAMNLVAVATNNGELPDTDIGTNYNGIASIVYADYPVVQTNTTGSASPWLDVNPLGTLSVKASATAEAQTLTGNGVGYHTVTNTTTDAEGQETTTFTNQSVAKTILEEVTKPNKRYFNLDDGDSKTFSKFLNKEKAAYLTTYQAEEGATTTAKNVDFPILVLASNAEDADTVLWTYIAALTNVSSGTAAKAQASSVTAATYKWNGSAFVKHTSSSLTVNDKKISTVKNQYDNQDSRFTLLDVKYKNPTTTTTNAAGDYFHLYVPVLVKKVLQVKYSIKMLAGTNYCADVYSGAADYATANFNEPVTALIEYNYDDRTIEDWNDALNNGEDLLWHYKKVFALKSSEIYDLPGGTRLTLVDVATGKAYFYTMRGSENNNAFDCEMNLKFSPLPICDYLVITVNNTAGTDATTPFVATTEEDATVKVGDVYYRLATTDEKSDSNIEKRYLKVERINTERYFLTIQVPETQGVSLINNLLDLSGSAMVRVGNAPPAVKTGVSQGRYVLYDGVAQSNFTITTERVDGSGTEMTGGDAIRVQLSSDLSLTEEGRKRYDEGFIPVDLNHRFTIDLKKVVGGNTTESVLGATGISWNYSVVDKNDRVLGTSDWCTYTPGELDAFSVSSGSYFKKGTMVEWIDQNETLTVTAEIILQYGNNVGSIFPTRTSEESDDGSYVHAESRVANAESQLPITENKKTENGENRYYCLTPSSASLTFEAIEFSGGEKTLQLGINSDDDYQPRIIQTESIYDYSEVEPATISRATHIRYTLELFRKQGNGLYNGTALSPVDEYLPIVREAGVSRVDKTSADGSKMTWTESLNKDATCDSTSFDFVPLTGAAFEQKGFTYANYMIRLTAELLEEKQDNGTIVMEVLPGTLASDYIVYTNARVLQKIPDDTSS